jgi:nucleoside-diphosphate-sugar epimerase
MQRTISSPVQPASSASAWSKNCWTAKEPRFVLPDPQGERVQGGRPSRVLGRERDTCRGGARRPDQQKAGRVSAEDIKKLKGKIDHFYHLAAVYDLGADEESQVAVNIDGTRNTVEFAKAIDAGHFHHVSSIAAAGLYEGVFREDMFEEAENYEHPYFMTKHESEKIVRKECKVPWSVFRPAMVVGDSTTGEMDKIDGPYYFFKLIQRMRQLLPPWMPAVGLEGGRINIVPVDFVVDALDHISHKSRHQQEVLPPGGPGGLPRRRRARHLQPRRPCAQDESVCQCCVAGLHSRAVSRRA